MADHAESWTVLRLLNWTKDYLSRAGTAEGRLPAEVLLAHVLKCKRIELYTRFDYAPAEAELAAFRELVKRAAKHEPVAYLVGEKEFYSLAFKVTPDVLVPRAETELLVSEAVAHLKRLGRDGVMWDVCTGSGCVAVATARHVPTVRVLATDISAAAVAVATENAAANKVQDRLTLATADLLTLPPQWADGKMFDVITANPPYVADDGPVADEVRHEPRQAVFAGGDGTPIIRRLIEQSPSFLPAGGVLVMEFGFDQADVVRDLIVASGAFSEPKILRDQQGIERAAAAVRK